MKQLECACNEIEQKMLDYGLTISQLIRHFSIKNSKLFNLSDEVQQKYCELFDEIESGKDDNTVKGKKLEQLVSLLFLHDSLFDCMNNFHTSTNEIDLLLTWNQRARETGITNSFPCFGDTFFCECKNYWKRVNVTYVGKFYSLLATTNVQFGFIVAWEGITGRGKWSDSTGLVKKIALREKKYIIAIDKNDLKQIYLKSKNIYAIIFDKYNALCCDIDYDKYISQHEAESAFIN